MHLQITYIFLFIFFPSSLPHLAATFLPPFTPLWFFLIVPLEGVLPRFSFCCSHLVVPLITVSSAYLLTTLHALSLHTAVCFCHRLASPIKGLFPLYYHSLLTTTIVLGYLFPLITEDTARFLCVCVCVCVCVLSREAVVVTLLYLFNIASLPLHSVGSPGFSTLHFVSLVCWPAGCATATRNGVAATQLNHCTTTTRITTTITTITSSLSFLFATCSSDLLFYLINIFFI